MAFKEVQDLSTDTVVAMGGINKKTGKANPTKLEGYYLGKREVEDKKKKSGFSFIYAFQTGQGNIGVWGKTDLDRKMASASVGAMTRITQSGTTPTPNGDMYKFKVEIDLENTIEVLSSEVAASPNESDSFHEDAAIDAEEEPALDEAPIARPAAPRAPAKAPSAAAQARVQALLSGSRPR